MKSFKLLIEPGTAFVIPKNAIHLDGLLSYCIGSRWDISDPNTVIDYMKELLEFDEKYGVFKASAMTLLATKDTGVTLGSIQRADDLRNKLTRDRFDTKLKTLQLSGGPTKKRLTLRQTYHAPFIGFTGVGDGARIKQLLKNHLPGIGTDAKTSSAGEIRSILELPGEFSYNYKGKAIRNMPYIAGAEFGFDNPEPVVLTPPYYANDRIIGYAPDRVNIQSQRDFLSNSES